jgi:tetratricopeptide (TPR) repeat protein
MYLLLLQFTNIPLLKESLLIWNYNKINMNHLKRIFLLPVFIFLFISIQAQEAAAVDSIKLMLTRAKTPAEKVEWLDNLSRTLMNANLVEAEKYGNQLITVAEESRDRELMIRAYMSNGIRCSYFAGQKDYTTRSIEYFNKALEIARQNRIEKYIGAAQLHLAAIHLAIPDKDKALSYINQAFSLISTLTDDSLKAEANNTYGQVYISRNEKILALRHYLNALRIAEEWKAGKLKEQGKLKLLRNCYINLSNFYSRIEDYDKAIDYYTLANEMLGHIKEKNTPYQRAIDYNSIGNLFAQKKNYDIAISYFERSIALADTLKFSTLKIPGYISLLNQYLRIDQPQKALDYLNSTSGASLKRQLSVFGFSGAIDQAYAVIYTDLNQFDSATKYFNRALPFIERSNNIIKVSFYGQLAHFYKKSGDAKKAIGYFLKVKEMSEANSQLENIRNAAKNLDSLYANEGNILFSRQYNTAYHLYKDSIEKLSKEKELSQVEATDEQQRQERILKEKEEAKKKRFSIQYMAITLAIAILFIGLVMMGIFKVSATTIRAIGFFAFLLFFEFIFLIFKKNIYGITHGEPWKDLAFIIALAALLVPLHHWLEHKVIHFLTSHHMLKFRSMFSKKDENPS